MIAEYEGGASPTCNPCSHGCEPTGYQCAEVRAHNYRLGLMVQMADVIRKDHNADVRQAVAGALFDAYSDYLPSGWLDEREWMDACGVAREAVAA